MDLNLKEENGSRIFTAVHNGNILGYVAIDSTIRGRSCGGLRMLPDIDEAEIRTLARSMTFKYGFLGLPQGGAKAGVLGNPEAPQPERMEQLVAFGRAIEPLLRTKAFIPTSDMGTQNSDIRHMLHSIGVHATRRDLRNNSSGYYTGLSVLAGVVQSARHLGLDLSRCTAAIEGFGNVGKPLAALLLKAGVKIVAISTFQGTIYNPRGLDVGHLIQLSDEAGSRVVEIYNEAERMDREELLELPVDILCPCARWNSLNLGNVHRIAAKVICSGANNPMTPDAENVLFERGVLCLPDFVTNCGGVLGGTMEFASIRREKISTFINHHIGARITWLLNEAKSKHESPREVAIPFTLRRFNKVAKNADHPTPLNRLFHLGLDFYRRGWIPGCFVAPLSLRYFNKLLT